MPTSKHATEDNPSVETPEPKNSDDYSREVAEALAAARAGALALLGAVSNKSGQTVLTEAREIEAYVVSQKPEPNKDTRESATLRSLTRREREILETVAEGCSNREVAKRFFVTEQTVKFHLSNLYKKLNVNNRTQASAIFLEHNFGQKIEGSEVKAESEGQSETQDRLRQIAALFVEAEVELRKIS